jgi:hypothetical protein
MNGLEIANLIMRSKVIASSKKEVSLMPFRYWRIVLVLLFSAFFLPFSQPSAASDGPDRPFDAASAPEAPDYSLSSSWAVPPESGCPYPADVFFIHPTTYDGDENWNQSLKGESEDPKVHAVMKNQAGVYSSFARLCAPYYRQANLAVLHTAEDSPNRQALDVAYSDVEAAFNAYMTRWNKGRPFILAGHSQGSELLLWLMERRFGDPALREKLVAAYLVGWSVTEEDLARFPHLKIAATPKETGAIVTYNTQGPNPGYSIVRKKAVAVNPLTMTITDEPVPAEQNLGAVFFTENGVLDIPRYTGGQTVNGGFVIPTPFNIGELDAMKIKEFYHPYDYTFFYRNLKENVKVRIRSYLGKDS